MSNGYAFQLTVPWVDSFKSSSEASNDCLKILFCGDYCIVPACVFWYAYLCAVFTVSSFSLVKKWLDGSYSSHLVSVNNCTGESPSFGAGVYLSCHWARGRAQFGQVAKRAFSSYYLCIIEFELPRLHHILRNLQPQQNKQNNVHPLLIWIYFLPVIFCDFSTEIFIAW